jgi:hypothetical protein
MVQQVIEILEGLGKPESVATGWFKDFYSAKEKVIGHLVEGSSDYLNADNSEKESETDVEDSDSTAAGMGDSPQGEPVHGEVSEKDIHDMFVIDEEDQSGNTGNSVGAPADKKLTSPYLAHAPGPALPPASASLDPIVVLRNQPASMMTLVLQAGPITLV